MKLTSSSIQDNGKIPPEFAFCAPDPKTHVTLSGNRNPELAWSDVPAATLSFALLCHDPDVPGKPDDVNQEGRTIPATLPRIDFYHWVLVDLPADARSIEAGEFSDGVTARGKPGPDGPRGTRQGINDYAAWFASDKDMSGNYFGYDESVGNHESRGWQQALDRRHEVGEGPALGDERADAGISGPVAKDLHIVARMHQHAGVRQQRLDAARGFDAVDAGQGDVHDQDLRRVFGAQFERALPALGRQRAALR